MQAETSEDAVDTFLAAFNASNSAYVTELLARALTSDVVFWGPLGRSVGVEAVETFITELRAHPEGPGTVTRTTVVDTPGEWARYSWSYRNEAGRPLALRAPTWCICGTDASIRWSSSQETSPPSEPNGSGSPRTLCARTRCGMPVLLRRGGSYSSRPLKTITRS